MPVLWSRHRPPAFADRAHLDMPQPEHLHALEGVPMPTRESVSKDTGAYWDKCLDKLDLVPNVIRA